MSPFVLLDVVGEVVCGSLRLKSLSFACGGALLKKIFAPA